MPASAPLRDAGVLRFSHFHPCLGQLVRFFVTLDSDMGPGLTALGPSSTCLSLISSIVPRRSPVLARPVLPALVNCCLFFCRIHQLFAVLQNSYFENRKQRLLSVSHARHLLCDRIFFSWVVCSSGANVGVSVGYTRYCRCWYCCYLEKSKCEALMILLAL